jgi:foldase protein PrsA
MRTLRLPLALSAVLIAALVLAACGGGSSVPGNAVASVDGDAITKADFQHWMSVAANSQSQTATTKTPVPDPPNYTKCIANLKKTTPKPAKGKPNPTEAQFKTQCQQQYTGLRDQVLNFLISADWLTGEASDQNVKVSDKQVQTAFNKTKKQSFPKAATFQSFLKRTGYTTQDLLLRQKLQLIQQKIVAKVTKGTTKVTNAQIVAYYNKNKARFAQPQRRDLRIVLTKTKAKADQAKAALQSGQSFSTVAKKFSIDQASKSQGGKLLGVAKGQQEKAFDTAVFKAQKGQLVGPVKTQFGYYVFKVQKITPASQQSLAKATPQIKQVLSAQNRQKAIDKFAKDWQKKWKAKTDCRKGFVIASCKNAPKPKATTTSTSGGTATPNTTATGQ